nr:BspA family leucine-rich repeat surface protein [Helicobacter bizzozeronii]
MFYGCESFNQPFQNWDVSKVKSMKRMFSGCWRFNQPLQDWTLSSIEDVEEMFKGCENFNQALGRWNFFRVPSKDINMFEDCTNLDGYPFHRQH